MNNNSIVTDTIDWDALLALAASANHVAAPRQTRRTNRRKPKLAASLFKHDLSTELGNARNFVETYQDEILYVTDEKKWYVWDTHRWVKDDGGAVRQRAASYGKVLADSSKDIEDSPTQMIKRVQSAAGIRAIVELAADDVRIQCRSEDFDCGPEELNTPAGVVNLRTGELTPPDSTLLVRRSTTVAPKKGDRQVFNQFLHKIFGGDQELIKFVQHQAGVTLYGGQPTQQFNYCKGSEGGADGKSRLLELFQEILGRGARGYSAVSDKRVFEKSNSDRHLTEIAKLAGIRMVVSSEVGSNKTLDTDKIKSMVAGDTITARFMYGNEFEFQPQFLLWTMSNHHVKADATDGAFWRRVCVLTFDHPTPLEDRIPYLDRIIFEEEGPAVLAWMIEGAADFLEWGYRIPDSVSEASDEYRAEVDTVAQWAEDSITPKVGVFASTNDLRTSYVRWCQQNHFSPVGPVKLGNKLAEMGYPRTRNSSGTLRGHSGIDMWGDGPSC